MPRPTMQNVKDVLGPYHARIRRVVELAWAEWRAVAAMRAEQGLPPLMYSRTVANYVFDAIARFAVDEFASDNFVMLKIEAQTVKFYFKAGVLVRFKKGDDNKLGRNIPTQSALAFADADCLFSDLPPDTAKVEVIWVANEIQTLLDHVLVVARDGDRLFWDYEIEESGSGEGTVVPFPMFPNDPDDDRDNEELIRAKKPSEENAEEKK